jgi:hypothetical protein
MGATPDGPDVQAMLDQVAEGTLDDTLQSILRDAGLRRADRPLPTAERGARGDAATL